MTFNKTESTIKREKEESDRLIQEFLDTGGKVTVCEPFATTPKDENPPNKWGAKKTVD
jgi:hypothetical protein|tara:strand:- start:6591 stop:6764 length:174 start_codon:yes stop_codon:yes gene_type:complete